MSHRPSTPAALIVVDVQQGFADPSWGARDNPDCEANISALLSAWRATGWPVVFVRHDSAEPGSTLAPGQPGNAFQALITGEPDLLVVKQTNSAFYGTPDLHAWLGEQRIGAAAVCGITTNHCCETTARMAGNLGYETTFVIDATHTFDRQGPDGTWLRAADLARATATSLHGEFATVVRTAELTAGLG